MGSTFLFSLCVLFDKVIGTNKIKSVYAFAVVLNIAYFPFIAVTAFLMRNSFVWGHAALYSAIAGLLWFFMWIFYWKALQKGEPSRVSAVFFTTPIWAAFIGITFLGEALSPIQWAGIFVVVTGAILTSLGGESHKKEVRMAYLYALIAALFAAAGNAIAKYAMADMPPLAVNSISYVAQIPFFIYIAKDSAVSSEIKAALRDTRMMIQFGLRGLLGYSAIMLNMVALSVGVVSLVSAIGGAQPVIILIMSLIGSSLLPHLIHEELGKNTLLSKLAALILTVGGVIMISL